MLEINKLELTSVSHHYGNSSDGISQLNLEVEANELICVIGPSGCGKSTLLKILAGQLRPISGEVLYNEESLYENLHKIRSHISYSPEEESFDPLLSIEENFNFSASIRCPDLSKEERQQKTQQLIKDLLLESKCTKIPGEHFQKLLSGGERKRLNVGLELTNESSVLLIDEPTTGLSSYDSENIINSIRERVDGKICFVSIHQPSRKLFKSFDKALLLDNDGNLAFWGSPDEMEVFFNESLQSLIDQSKPINQTDLLRIQEIGTPEFIIELIQLNLHNNFDDQITKPQANGERTTKKESLISEKKRNLKQFNTHLSRTLLSKLRNKSTIFSTLVISPLLALLVAGVLRYSESQRYIFSEAPHIPAYIFISLVVAMFLGLTNSANEIIRDKGMLSRERGHGIIVSQYILSKFIILLLFSVTQSWIYLWIGNSILLIHHMTEHYMLWMVITNLVGSSIGLLISVSIKSNKGALSLIPIIIIPQILLAGALIEYKKINPSLYFNNSASNKHIKHQVPEFCNIIPLRWSYESLIIAQNEYNLLSKSLRKIDSIKTELLKKKTLTQKDENILSQYKDAYTLLFGLKAKNHNEITAQIEHITNSLSRNSFNSNDYLNDGELSATQTFLNSKVRDLVTLAEIEIEDYRNHLEEKKPNIFLGKTKYIFGGSFNTIYINFLVMCIFVLILLTLTGFILRKKLSSSSGHSM